MDEEVEVALDGRRLLVFRDFRPTTELWRYTAWEPLPPDAPLRGGVAMISGRGWYRKPLTRSAKRAIHRAFPDAQGTWRDGALWSEG